MNRNAALLTPLSLKLLKDYNARVTCDDVVAVSSGLNVSSTGKKPIFDRFESGAGERIEGRCASCQKKLDDISDKTKTSMKENYIYCSFECAEKQRLRAGSTRIRSQLFALERGVCQECGMDAHAFFKHVSSLEPSTRLNVLLDKGFAIPKTSAAMQRFLNDPREHDFWQADHKVAVAKGGGLCGLDNFQVSEEKKKGERPVWVVIRVLLKLPPLRLLGARSVQTLCTTCHKRDTRKLHRELIVGTGSKNAEVSSRNIADMFQDFASSSGKKNSNCEEKEKEKEKKRKQKDEIDLTNSDAEIDDATVDSDDSDEEVENVVKIVEAPRGKKKRRKQGD